MKLYYSPFACSLASHIACREANIDVTLVHTELATKRIKEGAEGETLFAVNPMGQVPTLVTDDGLVLTENAVVLTYIADRVPESKLAPSPTSFARYELARWLSFVATELHKKGLAMIFQPDSPDAVKEFARVSLKKPVGVVNEHLTTRETLLTDGFTVADAYLMWALTLMPHAGVPLEGHAALTAYYARHMARPAVRAAMRFERTEREKSGHAAAT